MNRVFVIGGAGFIGRHLLQRLVDQGTSVISTCRPGAAPPAIGGVRWLATDLAAPDAATSWPGQADSIVHLAQSRAWRRFPEGARDVFQVNIAGVFQAAEHACKIGAQRLIYVSSGSVYGDGKESLIEQRRFEVPGTRQFYPAAKLAAEVLLAPFASRLTTIVLRPFVPYGRGQGGDMLLPRLVDRVRSGEPIMLQGRDGFRSNPVAVADLVEVLDRCLALGQSATLNVAGPEIVTLRQIGDGIAQRIGAVAQFDLHPDAVPADIVADTTQLHSVLGWSPRRTLADGLREWLDGPRS